MVRKEREPQTWRPNQGDVIICVSKNVPYEARVLQVGKDPKDNDKSPETKYLVHYKGWSKNWDEWVKIDQITDYSEEKLKGMKEAAPKGRQTRETGSARKKLATQQSQVNTSVVSTTQEIKNEEPMIIEPEKPVQIDKELKIKIPDELKVWLIDDDNNIKNKKLTILPAEPPITKILNNFVVFKKTSGRNLNEAVWTELTLGIKDYFNVMLGSHLLYKFERLQYQQLLKDEGKDVDLTNHYGVIHLVRLFTKIGLILSQSTLESHNVKTIIDYMQELLKYISKQTILFDTEKNYTVAPPDYIKNALK